MMFTFYVHALRLPVTPSQLAIRTASGCKDQHAPGHVGRPLSKESTAWEHYIHMDAVKDVEKTWFHVRSCLQEACPSSSSLQSVTAATLPRAICRHTSAQRPSWQQVL